MERLEGERQSRKPPLGDRGYCHQGRGVCYSPDDRGLIKHWLRSQAHPYVHKPPWLNTAMLKKQMQEWLLIQISSI